MKVTHCIFAGCIALLLSSCTFIGKLVPGVSAEPTHRVRSVALRTAGAVSQSIAVDVDIVFIFDAQLAELLPRLAARDWFRDKASYLARHSQALTVHEFELVPSAEAYFDVIAANRPRRKASSPDLTKARTVVVFANRIAEDQTNTLDISTSTRPVICLKARETLVLADQDSCVE